MPKIIHAGDIHLDSHFSSLPPELARARRTGLRAVFSKIIDIANSEAADALLLCGDIFDGYPIHKETEESFLQDLARANMPVFITPGNHDPYTSDSPYRTLTFTDNVYTFTSTKLTAAALSRCKLRIFGACYYSEQNDDRLLRGFKVPEDDFVNVVMLHSNLDADGYCPVSTEEIGKCGADYVALSHIHKPTPIMKIGKTHFAYCGCPEARDFGEAYDTGIYICEVTKDGVRAEHRRISDIRYRDIRIDISDDADIEKSLPSPSEHEHLRITLTGECTPPDIDSLYTKLSGKYAELQIRDNTTEPRDISGYADDDSLRGVFLQKMRMRLDSATDEAEREKILLAIRYGLDAIENRDI